MNPGTLAHWSGWQRWLWLPRACALGLVLADIWLGHPVPGLSGRGLVLLVGLILAGLAWLAWLPERVDERIRMPVLIAGIVGGGLASLISSNTAAVSLPAVIALAAGSSFGLLEGAVVAACGLITLGVGSLVITTSPGFSLLGSSLAVAGGLLAGLWRAQYRLRAEQAELAAVQTQRAEQEHVRAQVLDERTRIAREIHDILAHTMGGLIVQLDAADALLTEGHDPEGGRRLVGEARHLAVAGLDETRQAIAALRADPVDLPEALRALTAADGRPGNVSYELRGTPRRLTPEAGLAVYRTAQEALANARKHAPGAAVAMTLSFGERETVLRVANATPAGAPGSHLAAPLAATGGGYGLSGLTERAELLGGALRAGPEPRDGQGGEGWAVELKVPQ